MLSLPLLPSHPLHYLPDFIPTHSVKHHVIELLRPLLQFSPALLQPITSPPLLTRYFCCDGREDEFMLSWSGFVICNHCEVVILVVVRRWWWVWKKRTDRAWWGVWRVVGYGICLRGRSIRVLCSSHCLGLIVATARARRVWICAEEYGFEARGCSGLDLFWVEASKFAARIKVAPRERFTRRRAIKVQFWHAFVFSGSPKCSLDSWHHCRLQNSFQTNFPALVAHSKNFTTRSLNFNLPQRAGTSLPSIEATPPPHKPSNVEEH